MYEFNFATVTELNTTLPQPSTSYSFVFLIPSDQGIERE